MRIAWTATLLTVCCLLGAAQADELEHRCALWVDPFRGEPIDYADVIDDLAAVDVVYLGEAHSVERHHAMQESILRDLGAKKRPIVLGLEQLERYQQPHLDRFNRGEIDFAELAKLTQWAERWHDYQQYRGIVEAARELDIPVLALNARAETIRKVFRSGGVEKLDDDARAELPESLVMDDPPYERLLRLQLMVHMAASQEMLKAMCQAQMCRDEAMADALCAYLQTDAGKGRMAVVLCGTGHIAYGHGTPSRVRRRLPNITDRVVVLSQSGDVEFSAAMKKASRDIEITHEQLRETGRPIGDYLHVTATADVR